MRNCWRVQQRSKGDWARLLDEVPRAGSCRRKSATEPGCGNHRRVQAGTSLHEAQGERTFQSSPAPARGTARARQRGHELDATSKHGYKLPAASIQACTDELRHLPEAAALLPFARLWLGRLSSFVCQQGPVSRSISQAEGVEQGDPPQPCFVLLGLFRALQQEIREDLGERILSYLDDVTILAALQRALHLVRRFESHLARHTRLRLHVAKTALWNEAGVAPDGLQDIQSDGRVWFGDQALEPASCGLVLLGTPFGSPQFMANHLQSLSARHRELLHMLPHTGDTQVAWLLLLYTAAPRTQFALRTLAPGLMREFAVAHDAAACARQLTRIALCGRAFLPCTCCLPCCTTCLASWRPWHAKCRAACASCFFGRRGLMHSLFCPFGRHPSYKVGHESWILATLCRHSASGPARSH